MKTPVGSAPATKMTAVGPVRMAGPVIGGAFGKADVARAEGGILTLARVGRIVTDVNRGLNDLCTFPKCRRAAG